MWLWIGEAPRVIRAPIVLIFFFRHRWCRSFVLFSECVTDNRELIMARSGNFPNIYCIFFIEFWDYFKLLFVKKVCFFFEEIRLWKSDSFPVCWFIGLFPSLKSLILFLLSDIQRLAFFRRGITLLADGKRIDDRTLFYGHHLSMRYLIRFKNLSPIRGAGTFNIHMSRVIVHIPLTKSKPSLFRFEIHICVVHLSLSRGCCCCFCFFSRKLGQSGAFPSFSFAFINLNFYFNISFYSCSSIFAFANFLANALAGALETEQRQQHSVAIIHLSSFLHRSVLRARVLCQSRASSPSVIAGVSKVSIHFAHLKIYCNLSK